MHPENLPIIIALASGITLGAVIGFLTASMRIHRALTRRERDTWSAASRYYRRQYANLDD